MSLTMVEVIGGLVILVIGLTIVAIGTASPEVAVSLQAASLGQGSLTLGSEEKQAKHRNLMDPVIA